MNTCEKIQFELSLLEQDQALSGSLERHLKDCFDCRHFAAELSLQEVQLRALIYPAAPDWAGRIESASDTVAFIKVAPNQGSAARRERLLGKIALAVALSASMMVGVVGWLTRPFLNGLMAPAGPTEVAQRPEIQDAAVHSVAFATESKAGNEWGRNDTREYRDRDSRLYDQYETNQKEGGQESIDAASAPQGRSGQGADAPAGLTGRDLAESNGQSDSPVPAPSRALERFRKELSAELPTMGASKDLFLRNQAGDAAILAADRGFLEQLKKAEKPETMVRIVQDLCKLQFQAVLDGLKEEDGKKAVSKNQLDSTKGEIAKAEPQKTGNFDSRFPEKGGGTLEDRASDTKQVRPPGEPGDPKSREMLFRGGRNSPPKAVEAWDELVRVQRELTDYKIAMLKDSLPSPSHAPALKPLIEELKKEHSELRRLALVHPGRAEVLTQLAELVQNSVATLEKPVDSKTK